jgi:integrase
MRVNIAIRKDKMNKQGFAPIVIQLSSGKEVGRIHLGLTVREKDFDPLKQTILRSHNEWKKYNEILESAKVRAAQAMLHYNDIQNYCFDCSRIELFKDLYTNMDADIHEVKAQLIKKHGPALVSYDVINRQSTAPLTLRIPIDKYTDAKNLVERFLRGERDAQINVLLSRPKDAAEVAGKNQFFDQTWGKYHQYCRLEKKASTANRVTNNLTVLQTFTRKYDIALNFDAFTEDFGIMFKNYLLKEHINYNTKKKGVSNGTVHNIQKSIAAFLNWAFKKGYNKSIEFKKWDTKKPKTHLHFLNAAQLKELYEYQLPLGGSLDKSRDLWIFAAYTGMRISDVEQWLPSNVQHGMIKYRSQKARKDCMVGLNAVSMAILEKYNGGLPKQNDVLVNRNIKKILTLMGYDKIPVNRVLGYGKEDKVTVLPLSQAITFHSARRSFINLMISKGVGVIPLSSMVGNDVNSLMVYYKADGSQLKKIMDEIALFN